MTYTLDDQSDQTSGTQSDDLTNTTSDVQTVTYTFTPHIDPGDGDPECGGGLDTVIIIYIEPQAKVTAIPQIDTICDGDETMVIFSTPTKPTRWVEFEITAQPEYTDSLSGYSDEHHFTLSDTLKQTLNNQSDTAQLIRYIITPYTIDAAGNQKCEGINDTVDIWVEPTPKVIAAPQVDTICDGDETMVTFSTPTKPTRWVEFEITAQPEYTDSLSGYSDEHRFTLSDTLKQTLNNQSDTAQLIRYIITPYTIDAAGSQKCKGINDTVDIWVEPTPKVIAAPQIDTICDSTSVTVSFTTPTRPLWHVEFEIEAEPEHPGSLSGYSDEHRYTIDSTLVQTLDNLSDSAQLIQYIIMPYTLDGSGNQKCPGIPDTVDVWVEPTPKVTAIPQIDTICDSIATMVTFTTPTWPTRWVEFEIEAEPEHSGSLSGYSDEHRFTTDSTLAQTLYNLSDTAQYIEYIITPWTIDASGNQKCYGINDTVGIWVEPTAKVTAIPQVDTICDSTAVTINFTTPTRPQWHVEFEIEAEPEHPGSLSGYSDEHRYTIDSTLVQTLDNLSDSAQLIQYIIMPYTLDGSGNQKCPGIPDTVDVWVEPTPKVTAIPQLDTICDGDETKVIFSTPTKPTRWVEFEIEPQPEYPDSLSGYDYEHNFTLSDTLKQILSNQSDTAQLIRYIITPYTIDASGEQKCKGINDTVSIWVEPTPKVVVVPVIDTLCNDDHTGIALSSPSRPTREVRFRYDLEIPYGVTVVSDSSFNLDPGFIITDSIHNATDTAKLVRYTIIPYTRMAGSDDLKCTGIPETVEIWIEPTPKVTLTPERDTICTELATHIQLTSVSRPIREVRFRYTLEYESPEIEVFYRGDTNFLAPGFLIIDSIRNTTAEPQLLQVIVTPFTRDNAGQEKCTGINDTAFIWIVSEIVIGDSVKAYIGGRNIRCFGENNGEIYLLPTGGISGFNHYDAYDFNYSWDNDSVTKDISQLYAGDYQVTVTDHFNCHATASFTLTEPDLLTASIKLVDSLSCDGGDGTLAVCIDGGTPDYNPMWHSHPELYSLEDTIYADTLLGVQFGYYMVYVEDTNLCNTETGYRINEYKPPNFGTFPSEYGDYNIRCHGESNGYIITNVDPTDSVEYHWTGPNGFDTTYSNINYPDTLYNIKAGYYEVTVVDNRGCHASESATLTQPDPVGIIEDSVSVYPGGYNVACYGLENGAIYLDEIAGGHGDYIFDWQTEGGKLIGAGSKDQVNIPAGSYFVEITDPFGCFTKDSFDLVQPGKLELEYTVTERGDHNVWCYGDHDAAIDLSVTGGDVAVGPYTYLWSDNSTTEDLIGIPAGDYSVTVTDGVNCTIDTSLTLTEPDSIYISSVLSDYKDYEISCFEGSNGEIHITPRGGTGDFSFEWTSNEGNEFAENGSSLTGLSAGTYNLILSDANNCIRNYDFVLEDPEEIITGVTTWEISCQGDIPGRAVIDVTGGVLTGNEYNYLWSNGVTSDSISSLVKGTFRVTVTDDNNCIKIDSAIIDQDQPLDISFSIVREISCFGYNDGVIEAIVSNGTEPYSYIWNTGSESSELEEIPAGEYTLTVTDDNSCSGTESIDIEQPEQTVMGFIVEHVSCYDYKDGAIVMYGSGGTPPYNYLIDGSPIEGSIAEGLGASNYTLYVEDYNNCVFDTGAVIEQPDPLHIEYEVIKPACPDVRNGSVILEVTGGTPCYNFSWDGFPGINTPVLNELMEGNYTVEVIDANNCSIKNSIPVKSDRRTCLKIPSAFSPNNDQYNDTWIINHPALPQVTIKELYPELVVQVYNRWGKLVYLSDKGYPNPWDGNDNRGNELPVDSYHYVIYLNDGSGRQEMGNVTILR